MNTFGKINKYEKEIEQLNERLGHLDKKKTRILLEIEMKRIKLAFNQGKKEFKLFEEICDNIKPIHIIDDKCYIMVSMHATFKHVIYQIFGYSQPIYLMFVDAIASSNEKYNKNIFSVHIFFDDNNIQEILERIEYCDLFYLHLNCIKNGCVYRSDDCDATNRCDDYVGYIETKWDILEKLKQILNLEQQISLEQLRDFLKIVVFNVDYDVWNDDIKYKI